MDNKFYIEYHQDFVEMTEDELERFSSYVGRSLLFNNVMFLANKDQQGTYNVRFIAYKTARHHTWAKIKSNVVKWIFDRKIVWICKRCGIEYTVT